MSDNDEPCPVSPAVEPADPAGEVPELVAPATTAMEELRAQLAEHRTVLETHAAALGAVGAQLGRLTTPAAATPPVPHPAAAASPVSQWM